VKAKTLTMARQANPDLEHDGVPVKIEALDDANLCPRSSRFRPPFRLHAAPEAVLLRRSGELVFSQRHRLRIAFAFEYIVVEVGARGVWLRPSRRRAG
jgi:hypothetical protein